MAKVKVVLSNRAVVKGLDPADVEHVATLNRLMDRFTFENPVYWDARRNRRPCRHIPRKIYLCDVSGDGTAECPRGALSDVEEILGGIACGAEDATSFPKAKAIEFNGELRDYQRESVDTALGARQGVLQAPTGSGKTVMAMALVSRLATSTLIIVHTSVLFKQTAEKIRRFLGIEPGLVGAGHDEPGDVTVAMVQTLMRRDLSSWRGRFGLVILDEAHHCPAETFKKVVQQFDARYRFGLTATPTRKDRLHPVLFDVVGPIVHAVKPKTLLDSGSIARAEVVAIETEFRGRYRRNDYQSLINRIVKNKERNALVANTIKERHRNRSLVLTERVKHGHDIALALAGRGMKVEAISGSTAREKREEVIRRFTEGSIELLVSTTALVGEGFDLPAIDCVFLTVPNGNPAKTTQVMGRALRPHKGKKAGIIVDFVDVNVPLLRNQYKRRARVYKTYG